VDKDKEEKRSNIIIKRMEIPKDMEKDWKRCENGPRI